MTRTGIFQLAESDRPALLAHLLRLSPDDRRSRFFCSAGDGLIEHFVQKVSLSETYGYFLFGTLIATSMVASEDTGTVEFSVSVSSEHRGRGLAKHLLEHGMRTRHAERAHRLVLRHVRDNHAMAAVHRHLPARRTTQDGEVDVVVDLESLRHDEQAVMSLLCGAEV
jgi:ribosomal protein S18 acetylase RimI-like enzyme